LFNLYGEMRDRVQCFRPHPGCHPPAGGALRIPCI